jgi:hypothetical protein
VADHKTSSDKIRELANSGTFYKGYLQVLDEPFRDEDFFDPQDLLQVKYEMLRRVKKDHWAVTKAAQTYGFSRFAYYDIEANFTAQGLAGLLPRKKGPRHAHKLSDEILTFISDQLELHRHSPEALANLLSQRFALEVHPRSIHRAMASWKKKH